MKCSIAWNVPTVTSTRLATETMRIVGHEAVLRQDVGRVT